jgi:hypothetical protein
MTLDISALLHKLRTAPQRQGTFGRGDPKPLDEYRVVLTAEERDWLAGVAEEHCTSAAIRSKADVVVNLGRSVEDYPVRRQIMRDTKLPPVPWIRGEDNKVEFLICANGKGNQEAHARANSAEVANFIVDACNAYDRLVAELEEWKQAASVEAGLRREAHAEIDRLKRTSGEG